MRLQKVVGELIEGKVVDEDRLLIPEGDGPLFSLSVRLNKIFLQTFYYKHVRAII